MKNQTKRRWSDYMKRKYINKQTIQTIWHRCLLGAIWGVDTPKYTRTLDSFFRRQSLSCYFCNQIVFIKKASIHLNIMAKKPFSIDDAFDDTLDDVVVRVYGSTTVEKPTYGAGLFSVIREFEWNSSNQTQFFIGNPQQVRLGQVWDLLISRLKRWRLPTPDCLQTILYC